MGGTSIRVSDETRRRLELEKREDESFDDVIRRLTSTNRWSGFGVLAGDERDTRVGLRRIRDEMRHGMDIEPEGRSRRDEEEST